MPSSADADAVILAAIDVIGGADPAELATLLELAASDDLTLGRALEGLGVTNFVDLHEVLAVSRGDVESDGVDRSLIASRLIGGLEALGESQDFTAAALAGAVDEGVLSNSHLRETPRAAFVLAFGGAGTFGQRFTRLVIERRLASEREGNRASTIGPLDESLVAHFGLGAVDPDLELVDVLLGRLSDPFEAQRLLRDPVVARQLLAHRSPSDGFGGLFRAVATATDDDSAPAANIFELFLAALDVRDLDTTAVSPAASVAAVEMLGTHAGALRRALVDPRNHRFDVALRQLSEPYRPVVFPPIPGIRTALLADFDGLMLLARSAFATEEGRAALADLRDDRLADLGASIEAEAAEIAATERSGYDLNDVVYDLVRVHTRFDRFLAVAERDHWILIGEQVNEAPDRVATIDRTSLEVFLAIGRSGLVPGLPTTIDEFEALSFSEEMEARDRLKSATAINTYLEVLYATNNADNRLAHYAIDVDANDLDDERADEDASRP